MHPIVAESYFDWLVGQVWDGPGIAFKDLFKLLFNTEFIPVHADDFGRESDGLALRSTYLDDYHPEHDSGCSILEALIALSNRLSFLTDDPTATWFWELLRNLGLSDYSHISEEDLPVVQDRLDRFVWRDYGRDGVGGIFPLHVLKNNQKAQGLWYQFCNYYYERNG
jgi:hypothetical protein